MSDDDHKEGELAAISRIALRGTRAGYRAGGLRSRSRAAYPPRSRRELPIASLIGRVIELRNLANAVREQSIAIAWRDIVGDRLAKHVIPGTLFRGVLSVWTSHPVWTHEVHLEKTAIVAQINRWVAARQAWLGTLPAVTELRSTMGSPRQAVVEPDDLRRLQYRYRRRPRSAAVVPPAPPTDAELEAITAETGAIEDPELRETIQLLRATWNR